MNVFVSAAPPRSPLAENRASVTRFDIFVFALICVFGATAFLFYQRSSDFLGEDVFFADCARSLVNHGVYGINGRPETNQPPGLSAILAMLFMAFGYSTAICLRAMAVFETLGFLVAYELLRRRVPKLAAAAICLVLISSPSYFQMGTQWVCPCFPVFFTTMAALLAFEEYEPAASPVRRLTWGFVLTAAIVASLMIASSAVALLGAIVMVIGVTALKDRRLALARLRRFLPILLVGIVVQGLWMHQKPAPPEWPLPGYPGPYLEQLKVKSGNYPEMGMATLGDIPARITTNIFHQLDLFANLLLRHGVKPSKLWAIILPFLLITMGWAYSIWQTGGGLLAWYFAGYELIYLLWPWGVESRFFLPIAPLACFFAWKGIKALHLVVTTKPRAVGIIWLTVGMAFTLYAWLWISRHWKEEHGLVYLLDELSMLLWFVSAVCAARMAYTGRPLSVLVSGSGTGSWFARPLGSGRLSPLRLTHYAGFGVVVMLVVIGVARQVDIARQNVRLPDLLLAGETARNPMASEVESGLWIRSHTPSNSIIMARHVPTVRHYAERRVVWFAPTSNPDILMQGIVRHQIDYVVVIKHSSPYYLPDDDYCFDRLLVNRGQAFRLVFRDTNLWIFQVDKTLAGVASSVIDAK